MIGLAAVVALVAVSAIGVASASADQEVVLCKVNEEKCKGTNYIGYAFTANATAMTFKFAESGTVQCSSNMVRSEGEAITTLSFSSCTEGCTMTAKSLPYHADMFEPIEGNGKLAMTVTGLIAKCGTSECVFSGGLEKLSVTGGKAAVIGVNNTLNEEAKNLLCPKSVFWEGTYTIKGSSAFVTKRATGPVFCTTNKAPCPAESTRLKPEFKLLPKTELVINSLGGGAFPVKCTEAGFKLSNVEIHEPNDTWNYEAQPIGGCTVPAPYSGCTVAMEGSPFVTTLEPSGTGSGTISVTALAKTPTLSISCKVSGAQFTCKYTAASGFPVKFTGGGPAKLSVNISMAKLSGPNGICLESVSMAAEYQSVEASLFMTSS
jgi:hypothetical protein